MKNWKTLFRRVDTPKDSYDEWLNVITHLVQKADEKFACKGTVGIGVPLIC